MPDIFIQLENHFWDLCPNDLGLDRMSGMTAQQRPGTFAYHCDFHGCTMAGTVTVT